MSDDAGYYALVEANEPEPKEHRTPSTNSTETASDGGREPDNPQTESR